MLQYYCSMISTVVQRSYQRQINTCDQATQLDSRCLTTSIKFNKGTFQNKTRRSHLLLRKEFWPFVEKMDIDDIAALLPCNAQNLQIDCLFKTLTSVDSVIKSFKRKIIQSQMPVFFPMQPIELHPILHNRPSANAKIVYLSILKSGIFKLRKNRTAEMAASQEQVALCLMNDCYNQSDCVFASLLFRAAAIKKRCLSLSMSNKKHWIKICGP